MVNTGKASNLLQHDAVFLRAYDNILDHRMQISYTNNINSCYMLKHAKFSSSTAYIDKITAITK